MDATQTYDAEQSERKVLEFANRTLEPLSAEARIDWALDHLPPTWTLTSSFGAQSAVMLHLGSKSSKATSNQATVSYTRTSTMLR